MTFQSELNALERKLPDRNDALDKVVRRYTTLSSALDTLSNRRIVLRNPAHWDDTNDSYFLDLYRLETDTPAIVAACFTRATETYHHWRIFTPASEGICIEIDRDSLAGSLSGWRHCAVGAVEYLKVVELAEFTPRDLPRLPFAKRVGYKDEREWRIVGLCDEPTAVSLPLPFNPSWVRRIILNPWMHPSLAENVRMLIRSIRGCESLKIEASQLTNSRRWKKAGKQICMKVSRS